MEPNQNPSPVSSGPINPGVQHHPRPPKKSNAKPFIAAIMLVAVIAVAGLGPRMSQSKKLKAVTQTLETEVPSVNVVQLNRTASDSDLVLPSNVQAIEQTTINARTSGYMAQRYVDIGSRVTKGELLAVVESPELDQQVSQTIAEASKSRAGLGSAQADSAKLLASISAAKADLSRSQSALIQARADLLHLQAKEQQSESAVNVYKARYTEATKRYAGSKAELNRAKAGLILAQKTLARWKELEKSAAVSGQDVDEKQAAYDSGQAQVEAGEANVSSAEAEVLAAKEAVQSAMAEVNASKADVQSGQGRVTAAQSSIESSRSNVTAAEASYRASLSGQVAASASISADQANVRRSQALQGFERITAPFSGVVTARNVDVGDLVNSTNGGNGASDQANAVTRTGLFGLAKTDVLRAQINVPEDSAATITKGQLTEVTISEFPHRTFKGTVFNVSGALDTASRTLLVEVRVPNADGALKPGMYAQIKFLNSKGAKTLWLPANALIFNAKGTSVATVDKENKLHYVMIKVGRDLGDKIEVLTGLNGNETVIANPDDSLPDGAEVKPLAESSTPNK